MQILQLNNEDEMTEFNNSMKANKQVFLLKPVITRYSLSTMVLVITFLIAISTVIIVSVIFNANKPVENIIII